MTEQRGRSGRGRGRGRGRNSAAVNRQQQQGLGPSHDHGILGRPEGAAQPATGSGASELGAGTTDAFVAREWAAPAAPQNHPHQFPNSYPSGPPQFPPQQQQYVGQYYGMPDFYPTYGSPHQAQHEQRQWTPAPSGDPHGVASVSHSSLGAGAPAGVQNAAGRGRGGRRGGKGGRGRQHEGSQQGHQQPQNSHYQQIQHQQNQQYQQAHYHQQHSHSQQHWVRQGSGAAPVSDSTQAPMGNQGLLPAPYPSAASSAGGDSLGAGPIAGRGAGGRGRGRGGGGRGGRGAGEGPARRGQQQGRGQAGGRYKQASYASGGGMLSALGSSASSESGSHRGGGTGIQSWLSGESVPELVQEIERRLRQEELECMICYETVRRKHAVWSCGSCYSIFHLHCAQAWASAPTSSAAAGAAPGQPSGQAPPGAPVLQSEGVATSLVLNGSAAGGVGGSGVENWRCPGCQAVQWGGAAKLRYSCFCGQTVDPPPDPFLIPHSCGETCRRPLGRRNSQPSDSSASSAAGLAVVPGDAEGGGDKGGEGGGGGGSGGSSTYTCPHHCVLQCHPGPCPPCSAMSGPLPCFCGREHRSRRCTDLSKEGSAGFSCGASCGKLLECGQHRCSDPCHAGACAPCSVLVDAHCFCGASEEALSCGEHRRMLQAEEQRLARTDSSDKQGADQSEASREEGGEGGTAAGGLFCCGKMCGRELSCGKHRCERLCHAGECGLCHLSPSVITTCPCAKHSLQDLLRRRGTSASRAGKASASLRTSCTDPVPTCGEPCAKLLACGEHRCKSRCHVGPCPRCEEPAEQRCVCGDTVRTAPCWQAGLSSSPAADKNTIAEASSTTGTASGGGATGAGPQDELLSGGPFRCDKKCNRKKNCGRHRCTNKCCPAASVGTGSGVQGVASLDSVAAAEEVHRCLLVCGKRLQCGQHSCQELCHSGHCPPCMAALFNELSCACGRTVIPPPNPCGTPLPACEAPCQKPQPCGHAAAHLCHFGNCPPCTVPAAKACVGGHVVLRGVPCGSKEIKCSQMCSRMRHCGQHLCQRTCHSGPCDAPPDSQQAPSDGAQSASSTAGKAAPVPGIGMVLSCGQPCGVQRKDCQHQCQASCHPGDACPAIRCTVPVTISCACGRLSAQVPCGAGAPAQAKPMALRGVPALVPGQEGLPPGKCKLACDEECEKLMRRRTLAEAFSPVPGGAKVDVSLYEAGDALAMSKALPPSVAQLLRSDPQWVAAVEARLQFLVLGPTRGASAGTASDTVIGGRGGWTRDAVRFHVFRPMSRERREALHFLAERWHLGVESKGREPRRFPLTFVTRKSRAPDWRLPLKPALDFAPSPGQAAIAPSASADIDFDPACVVPLVHLPSDTQLGKQLLRFGGECELFWLSDSNAVAIFEEKGRAATARRFLDHTCAYVGAIAMPVSGTVGTGTTAAFSSAVKGWGQPPTPSAGWAAAAAAPTGRGRAAQAGVGDAWADEVPAGTGSLSSLGSAVVASGVGAVLYGRTGTLIEAAANPFDALEQAEKEDSGAWKQVKSSKPASGARATEPERVSAPEAPRPASLPPQGEEMEDWEDMVDD